MDFALTEPQQAIRDQILRICARFDDTYWLERDRDAVFPHAFFNAMAEGNWLGVAMPEQYGGAGPVSDAVSNLGSSLRRGGQHGVRSQIR